MFKQIETSIDPNIIGGLNKIDQLSIDVNKLNRDEGYLEYKSNIDKYLKDIKAFENLSFNLISAKIFNKSIVTDIMTFSPFIRGFKYVVSEFFINCLIEYGIKKSEFCTKEIEIRDSNRKFFLLFIPVISSDLINFEESVLYKILLFNVKFERYLNIRDFNSYQKALEELTFVSFEKVALSEEVIGKKSILNIQTSTKLYFEENLFNYLIGKGITNLYLEERQVNLDIIKNN